MTTYPPDAPAFYPSDIGWPDDVPGTFSWPNPVEDPEPLVERLAFEVILCKKTGEPVGPLLELAARKFDMSLNLPYGFTIQMRMDDPLYSFAAFEQEPRIKVFRPATPAELVLQPDVHNVIEFYGTLPSEGIDEDAESGIAELAFQDPMWVLNQRNLSSAMGFTSVDQGLILWQIIAAQNARTNGDTWIRQGATTTGTARTINYEVGKEVAAIVQDMTTVDEGCDVYFQPADYWEIDGTRAMGTFNAFSQRGSDKPNANFVFAGPLTDGTVGGLPGNVGNMKRRRTKTVTSATASGGAGVQTYQNTSSPHGLLEVYESFNDIDLAQALLDKAVGRVANGQNAPMILEIMNPTREAPQPILDYDVGDQVYSSCRRGGMQFFRQVTRVHGASITIDQEGVIDTKLTLASLPEVTLDIVLPPATEAPPAGDEVLALPSIDIQHGAWVFTNYAYYTYDIEVDIIPLVSGVGNPAYFVSRINGMIPGQNYTLQASSRGDTGTLGTPGTYAALMVGENPVGLADFVFGPDVSSHVFDSTEATRTQKQVTSMTFTALHATMDFGAYIVAGATSQEVIWSDWSIVPAP